MKQEQIRTFVQQLESMAAKIDLAVVMGNRATEQEVQAAELMRAARVKLVESLKSQSREGNQ